MLMVRLLCFTLSSANRKRLPKVGQVVKCDDTGQSLLRIIGPSLCKIGLCKERNVSQCAAKNKKVIM
jgi:hypothetical protein